MKGTQRILLSLIVALPCMAGVVATFGNNSLSLEYCTSDNDCQWNRRCFALKNDSVLAKCDGMSQCFCRDEVIIPCVTSKNCKPGERCVRWRSTAKGGFNMCASCRVNEMPPLLTFVDGSSSLSLPAYSGEPEEPAYSSEPEEAEETLEDGEEETTVCAGAWPGGYSGDRCTRYYPKCVGSRVCQQVIKSGSENGDEDVENDADADRNTVWGDCKFEDKECFCWLPKPMRCGQQGDPPCNHGEVCVDTGGGKDDQACYSCFRYNNDHRLNSTFSNLTCYLPSPSPSFNSSPSATATPSVTPSISVSPTVMPSPPPPLPDRSAACIHADALSHLPSEDLVFPSHIRANVLCDKYGSCATPGHIIFFHGRPMRMVTYCSTSVAKCTHRHNVWVNSPKMRRAWRLSSRTPHFHYSALSARYNTRLEEIFIQILIRLGL